jgi:hypothetical protein
MAGGWYAPLQRGVMLGAAETHPSFCWLVALWLYAFPLTHPPPALHVLGLTCCQLLPHSTVRAPWPKIRRIEEDCFGIAQFHGMQPLQCVCEFRKS